MKEELNSLVNAKMKISQDMDMDMEMLFHKLESLEKQITERI